MGRVLWPGRRRSKEAARWWLTSFLKKDNPIGIGAFGVIVDTPAICSFREFLVVDQDQQRAQAGGDTAREDRPLKFDRAAHAHFADFEGYVTTRFEHPVQFA